MIPFTEINNKKNNDNERIVSSISDDSMNSSAECDKIVSTDIVHVEEPPEHIKPFLVIEQSQLFPIDRYYVNNQLKRLVNDIVQEEYVTQKMRERGISYINTTLLYGPTGTGKTTMGRYIAYRMNRDFIYIKFASVISGVFGNTSRNIEEIFKYISRQQCVFMLDEIDCISQKRGTESDVTGGELARITITLMQELDILRKIDNKVILLAATNRDDTMDEALLSRFSIQEKIDYLPNEEKMAMIKMYLDNVKVPYDEKNIEKYCSDNPTVKNRNIEEDIKRCIKRFILNGEKDFKLDAASNKKKKE